MLKLNINDFKSLEDFANLQQKFSCEDYHYKMYSEVFSKPKVELLKEDFSISCQVADEISEDGMLISTKMEHLYFFKDFLNKRLQYLAEDYIHDFHTQLRRELEEIEFTILGEKSESKDEKRKLTLLQQKVNKSIDTIIFEIKNVIQNIESFKFLPHNSYNMLNIQFNDILKAVSDPLLKSGKAFHIGKLCFNDFTSFDVAVLFYHLRDQGIFKFVNHADLARFIENNFCIRKKGEYHMISKTEDYLSELTKIRTDETSLQKLKKIFESIPSKI